MANSLRTRLRIAASVLFATGFWDAIAGRFLFETHGESTANLRDASASLASWPWCDLRGAVHVHTTYSDGAGDVPTVMEAAKAAGVDWILLCDHNSQQPLRDGWEERYPTKPLLLIGTEVTVKKGAFLLALDMPAEWEPVKETPPQVAIDAINAEGGLALVSLPFDVKHPWRDWDAIGYEGLEVMNFSTVARRHINLLSLAWLLPLYGISGIRAVLRALVTRPDQALARWDSLTANGRGKSIGIGALDAHALMKIGKRKYPIPSYEDTFWAATTHVLIDREADLGVVSRRSIYDALRNGRCYFSYDCVGDPTGFQFYAQNGDGSEASAVMGEQVALSDGVTPLELIATSGKGVLLRLFRDGKIVAAGSDGHLSYSAFEPGAYRVEGYRYALRLGPQYLGVRPYLFSNPIYVVSA